MIRRSFLQSAIGLFLGKKDISEEAIADKVFKDLSNGVKFMTKGEITHISGMDPYYKNVAGRYMYYVNVDSKGGVASAVEEVINDAQAERILQLVASK